MRSIVEHLSAKRSVIRHAAGRRRVIYLMICSLLVASLMSAGPLRAEGSEGCLTGREIDEVARFVAEETGTLVPEVCVRHADLTGGVIPQSSPDGTQRPHEVAALFIPATREILLAPDLDLTTPTARGYLVHELVHAQQLVRQAHSNASCPGSLEAEAYNLQALYLSVHGQGPSEETLLLQVIGMFQGVCGYSN
jgi:hypothetical protein